MTSYFLNGLTHTTPENTKPYYLHTKLAGSSYSKEEEHLFPRRAPGPGQ